MQADKNKINRLLETASGQIDGILKMIEVDRYCVDISNQLMATQAILKRANQEIIRAHMKCCVKDAMEQGNAEEKIEELIGLMDKIAKNQKRRQKKTVYGRSVYFSIHCFLYHNKILTFIFCFKKETSFVLLKI